MNRRRSIALLSSALATLTTGCSLQSDLPIYGTVPFFRLTDQDGKEFRSDELMDRIYVASFFFTTCNGPCPRMNAQMKKIQEQTDGLDVVRMLSITIDPKTDTPAELRKYAARFKADHRRWHFLTGDPVQLNLLSDDTFHLQRIQTPTLDHSTRFILVDRRARIRGYYDTSDATAIQSVLGDIQKLQKEIF
jgi:protein SCO1/2